ncbi:MAG: hypothetical protein JRI22_20145 [Deltaproteobacteria bacterium]|nr:hypothetical protein [Deltaproteobacteria bacterium]
MKKKFVCCAILLSGVVLSISAQAPEEAKLATQNKDMSDMDKARMDAAIHFAETVLKYGRDIYGKKHTPLFIDTLDVDTMQAPEKTYLCRVWNKPCPRQYQPWQPVISSNLAYQCNLMRFLVGLSNLTGDPKYKEAYKDNLRYYFEHYQTEAGVLSMGHHRFIDLKADHYDGDDWPPGDRGHEMKGDFPYYELLWETDPQATSRMLAGHWNCHIKNWDNMDFTRHGRFNKKFDEKVWDRPMGEPVKGIIKGDLTFFGSACDIIWAGAKLSQLSGDESPLKWAKRLFARYIDSEHPKTGIPPCHHTTARDFTGVFGIGGSYPEYALLHSGFSNDLFGDGATAMMRLGDALGEKGAYFRKSVRKYLKAYAKYAYHPEDNTMRCILYDGTDLSDIVVKKRGSYGIPPGGVFPPWKAGSNYMISYALCYRQSKDREIWDILRAICRGNDLGDIGVPGEKAPKLNLATSQSDPDIIFALVEIFRATDNTTYLDLARVIGNNALKQHYNAEKGLFVANELHKVANLNVTEPLAFLRLEAALNGKLDMVPTYDGSTVGNSSVILRPTKALLYHPSASHCWYPDTVEAMCDELIPDSSNDSSIPRMSWYRLGRRLKTVVASFPDILNGPVSIIGPVDSANAKNQLGGIIIDSPFSYTFVAPGSLSMSQESQVSEDFTVTVLQGDHEWQAINWYPAGTMNYILDIAAGNRFTFAGLIYEYYRPNKPYRPENLAGLIKNGDGTAVVTGDYGPIYQSDEKANRAYRGDTVINAGVLLVNNPTGTGISPCSAVQVNDGGTLGGHGAIGNGGTSAIVNAYAGGTIAPGSDKPGTLTLRDGLTLHEGAKLAFELGTASDLLKVTGGTFTGSGKGGVSVSIADSGGLVVGKTYDLIDWTGATPNGIDTGDFVADTAGEYVGTFNISGSRLQITITESTKELKETEATGTPAKVAATTPGAKTKRAVYTWTNPNGGNWTDGANWDRGVAPNGPAKEWAQYNFEKPRKISSVDVYWLDDKNRYRVPESWRVLYRMAGEWKPVEAVGEYGVAKDRFNEARFKQVETDALRLEVKLQPHYSGGILEWRVNP